MTNSNLAKRIRYGAVVLTALVAGCPAATKTALNFLQPSNYEHL